MEETVVNPFKPIPLQSTSQCPKEKTHTTISVISQRYRRESKYQQKSIQGTLAGKWRNTPVFKSIHGTLWLDDWAEGLSDPFSAGFIQQPLSSAPRPIKLQTGVWSAKSSDAFGEDIRAGMGGVKGRCVGGVKHRLQRLNIGWGGCLHMVKQQQPSRNPEKRGEDTGDGGFPLCPSMT